MVDEPEVLDASRGYDDAQAALTTPLDETIARRVVTACWYDTKIDSNVGSFAMVRAGSDLEELVGDIILVRRRGKSQYLYVFGTADLPTDLGIQRGAFLRIADLVMDEIRVTVDVTAVEAAT